MDRRSFILSSLAAIGTIATAKIAAAAEVVIPAASTPSSFETLNVELMLDGMLSFKGRATDWDMRPWTWRMYFANKYHGDPDRQLSEDGLQYAASYLDIDTDDDDNPGWRAELDAELDKIHPDDGTLPGQEDEYRFHTSPTARAYYLVKEIVDELPPDSRQAVEEELGLWFNEDGLGVIAYIGVEKADLLAEIIETLKLPIKVKEV